MLPTPSNPSAVDTAVTPAKPERGPLPFILWLLLLGGSAYVFWVAAQRRVLNDDAYITLTYVRSLLEGRGFVFNFPPASLGTTSPLYALVVAALSALAPGVEPSRMAVAVSAASWVGVPWLLFLGRKTFRLEDRHAAVAGFVLLLTVPVGALGMESTLFQLLLLLAMYCFLRGWWLAAGAGAGLLFLTRGEGALLLPLLVGALVWREWRARRKLDAATGRRAALLLLGFATPVGLWALYAQPTFGSVLPSTLQAKLAQTQIRKWPSFARDLLLNSGPSWGRQFNVLRLPFQATWWLLITAGLVFLVRQRCRWALVLAWTFLYVAAYSILRVPSYAWYYFPVYFALQACAGFGLVYLVEAAWSRLPAERSRGLAPAAALLTALLLVLVADRGWAAARADLHETQAEPTYLPLVRWLKEHTPEGSSVAYHEVGFLGYFTRNRVVDLLGLVTPELIPYVARDDINSGFWRRPPDYYVYRADLDDYLGKIRQSPQFDRHYRPVVTLPAPKLPVTVYERVRAPVDETAPAGER